ncbi:hypothetical protein LAZ67_16001983 [Cordylochernes scorpioides]|uniref:Integrase catalytic domain-containing protein n=1 Tax=Cordylochernes scorpioides TaxID=51811 RepID=A0ABY6LBM8_9ARAC|nr:hypothetical protein LAZ67_16001983 [Cordylochernes scorpioides]
MEKLTESQIQKVQSVSRNRCGCGFKLGEYIVKFTYPELVSIRNGRVGGFLPFLAPFIPSIAAALKAATLGAVGAAGAYGAKKLLGKEIDYNPEAGYRGINDLVRKTGYSQKEVREFLHKQDVYTLHKPIEKKIETRGVYAPYKDYQWVSDLAFMQKDEGFKYILTIIDAFTKYAWAIPIRNKTGDEITNAFREIFKERNPERMQRDKGTEFIKSVTQNLLKKHNIEWFATQNVTKREKSSKTSRAIFVHNDMNTCSHVFLSIDRVKKALETPYQGPYRIMERLEKYFVLDINGKNISISIAKLKPAYLDAVHSGNNTNRQNYNLTEKTVADNVRATRSGRKSKQPVRFNPSPTLH